MAYLTGFGLENFRVFKDYTWFDFGPITILVGPNNSGKSSLIKAMLLMDDNLNGESSDLNLNGLLHNLGTPDKILNDESTSDVFSFVVPLLHEELFTSQLCRRLDFSVKRNSARNVYQENLVLEDLTPIYTRRTLGIIYLDLALLTSVLYVPEHDRQYSSSDKTQRMLNALGILKEFSIYYEGSEDFYEIDLWSDYEILDYPKFQQDVVWVDGKSILSEEANGSDCIYTQLNSKLYKLPNCDNINYFFTNENAIELYLRKIFPNNTGIKAVARAICTCLNYDYKQARKDRSENRMSNRWPDSMNYLPSVKGFTKRSYQSSDNHIINEVINTIRPGQLEYEANGRRGDFLKKWSEYFGINEIKIERFGNLGVNSIQIGEKSMADLGYGYTQLAALLLTILSEKSAKNETIENHVSKADPFTFGSMIEDMEMGFTELSPVYFHNSRTILLEEPESNLHPKFQSQLADLLNASRKYADQFIVETHSEYMIRKFQYLVAKGEMKPEDIVIHYFHDPNDIPAGEKQVKKITILEDGSLSDDFGPGFFDEAATWKFELLRLKNTRKN